MSRRLWRCRNRACPVPHGAVLGSLARDSVLVIDHSVLILQCYLDTRRAAVTCPQCGRVKDFHGTVVLVRRPPSESAHSCEPSTERRAGFGVNDLARAAEA